jgi:hypothetical protein
MMTRAPWLLLFLGLACQQGAGKAPPITYPGVDGHAPFFQLAGTSHEPSPTGAVQCESCHSGSTFTEFDCRGCHTNANPGGSDVLARTDALHTDAGGNPFVANGITYAFVSATCLLCHRGGQITHSFFPIGASSSHNLVCNACHTVLTAKSDLAKLACVSCHGATPPPPGLKGLAAAHQALPQPEYPVAPGNDDCIRCHADGQVDRIASHGRQPAPVGMGDSGCRSRGCSAGPGDGNHSAHCFQCHASKPPLFQAPPSSTGSRPWAQDWSPGGLVDPTATDPTRTSCGQCH